MEKINKDFNIPFYIFEELISYIEETAKGRCRSSQWQNLKALLRLARINNRLSNEQVDFLIEKYNRE